MRVRTRNFNWTHMQSFMQATHSKSMASNLGGVAGGVAPCATAALYRACASPAIAALMSDADTAAPRSARGMARLPAGRGTHTEE